MWLYHATYRPYLGSILKWGLGGAPEVPPKNYPDSEDGVVYLASSADVAVSYAETTEVVPDDWLEDIVVLRVDTPLLNSASLRSDPNVIVDDGSRPETWAYFGVIPPAAFVVVA